MSYPVYPPPSSQQPQRSLLLGWLIPLLCLLVGFALYRYWIDRGLASTEPRLITARGDLAEDEKSTIDLFRKASKSVVFITTLRPGRDFKTMLPTEIPAGTESGFIWDNAGHIVTNFHVVQSANSAQVTLNDHSTYNADLVGIAPNYDLALLRINAPASKLTPIPLGESADLQVGQKVFAIGNPFGLDQSLTTGVVSALGRTINAVTGRPIEDMIQIDASVNPGNSGGPLLDSAGRLIGVNTAIYSPTGASAGIGFAIPIDSVNRTVARLIKDGRIVRPGLNIKVAPDTVTQQLGIQVVSILAVLNGGTA